MAGILLHLKDQIKFPELLGSVIHKANAPPPHGGHCGHDSISHSGHGGHCGHCGHRRDRRDRQILLVTCTGQLLQFLGCLLILQVIVLLYKVHLAPCN